jgi:hypothetical protein
MMVSTNRRVIATRSWRVPRRRVIITSKNRCMMVPRRKVRTSNSRRRRVPITRLMSSRLEACSGLKARTMRREPYNNSICKNLIKEGMTISIYSITKFE